MATFVRSAVAGLVGILELQPNETLFGMEMHDDISVFWVANKDSVLRTVTVEGDLRFFRIVTKYSGEDIDEG